TLGQTHAAASLEPAQLSRRRRRRRQEDHLGTQPPPVFSHARPRLLAYQRRTLRGTIRYARHVVDGPEPAEAWHQLGQQSRNRVSLDCVVVGVALLRTIAGADYRGADSPAQVFISECFAPRDVSLNLLQSEHAPDRRSTRALLHRPVAAGIQRRGALA